MRSLKHLATSASLLLGLGSGVSAMAQMPLPGPWVQMQSTSVNLGVGSQSGDGMLFLPNLGTNCQYPFAVQGFGVGAHVGVSVVSASGAVRNMTKVADLSGDYGASQGEATLVAGAGMISMRNRANNVAIDLDTHTQGLALGAGAQGMAIKLDAPPANGPRTYTVQFGFDKTWVNKESRATLDQLIAAWKCQYSNFQLVGHTDTVGKEDDNLELSARRARAVADYLRGAGVAPNRIMTRPAGEAEPIVATGDATRLRANRAVVITVTP